MTSQSKAAPAPTMDTGGIRTLWLIRHGDALAPEPGQRDRDRALSPLGERNALRMAERLAATATTVGWMWVSPSTRTRSTAAPIQVAFRVPAERCVSDPGIYLADVPALLGLLRSSPVDELGVALIGHNPGISQLAQLLSDSAAPLSLPTLGCVCLQSVEPLRDWSRLETSQLQQTALLAPAGDG